MANRGCFITRNFVIHTAYLVKSKNNVAGCVANMEERGITMKISVTKYLGKQPFGRHKIDGEGCLCGSKRN